MEQQKTRSGSRIMQDDVNLVSSKPNGFIGVWKPMQMLKIIGVLFLLGQRGNVL